MGKLPQKTCLGQLISRRADYGAFCNVLANKGIFKFAMDSAPDRENPVN